MSLRAMFSGLSGLRNSLTAIDVVGNNIANMNTIGFKAARVQFQDLLSQTITGATSPISGVSGGRNPQQVGLGIGIAGIDVLQSQGNLQNTGNTSDLAIQGSGFFIVSDGSDSSYTRAGNFTFDRNGTMVHASGAIVQGWTADENGAINTSTAIGNLIVPVGTAVPAKSTTQITFEHNLNSNSNILGTASLAPGNTCGISNVQGVWSGQGGVTDTVGTHSVSVNAYTIDQSSLVGSDTLSSKGVTSFSDFTVTVDGSVSKTLTGLTGSSTIEDLVVAINSQVPGVTAVLAGGTMTLSRNKAGSTYTIALSDATANTGVVDKIFPSANSTAATATFAYTSGDGLSTLSSTSMAFAEGDTSLTGINGISIKVGSSGYFKSGTATINTLAADEHITSAKIYDSLGTPHEVKITFVRTANNRWGWSASSDAGDVSGSGSITFSSNGTIATGVAGTLTVSASGGANALTITPNFGAITQFSGTSTVLPSKQDGNPAGTLQTFNIGPDGIISGLYNNGVTRNLGQISMATFNNPGGLVRSANSMFKPSNNSGDPQVGTVGSGGRGTISSGTLEMSNIDLAQEFSNMIVYQKGFQASSKMITTGDDLLQTLVNLKR